MGVLSVLNAITGTEGVGNLIYRTALDGINLAANVDTFIIGGRQKSHYKKEDESLETIRNRTARIEKKVCANAASLESYAEACEDYLKNSKSVKAEAVVNIKDNKKKATDTTPEGEDDADDNVDDDASDPADDNTDPPAGKKDSKKDGKKTPKQPD